MSVGKADRCVIVGADWGGLAVAEDLHRIGVETLVVRTRPQEFAHLSRFATKGVSVPLGNPASTRLLEVLERETEWHGGSLVATTDSAVEYLSRRHEELAPIYHYWGESWDTTRQLLDKRRLYGRAAELGIPVPRTVAVSPEQHPTPDLSALAFPLLVKPCRGHEFFARFKAKMFVAQSAEQLQLALRLAREADQTVMVSEIIPGDDSALHQCRLYVDRRGELLAALCTRKLRQHPPGFGCGRVSRTVPMIEELRDAGLRLLDSCGYRGFAHAEFKRDARDGVFKLIEVNVRPPAMQRLTSAAGISFSRLAHLDRVHGLSETVTDYEPGVHWIDLFMDPVGWVRWRKAEGGRRSGYFKPYFGRRVFNVRPLADPVPFLAKAWTLLRQAPAYIGSRRDKTSGSILSSRGNWPFLTSPPPTGPSGE